MKRLENEDVWGQFQCRQMHRLLCYLGDDVVLHLGGGTIEHSDDLQEGAEAIEATIESSKAARHKARINVVAREQVLRDAAKTYCPQQAV